MRFVVRDTGIGIPAPVLEQLFSPFVQADASTTRRHGGTGLGLSIAKGLVEAMGGQMGAESTVGEGSRFWFTLPLRRASTSPSDLDRLELGTMAGVRVLGVDDSETNRKVMAGMLDSWGCRHTEVAGAKEALAALREAVAEGDPYRVAVLDMCMPEMDGEELAQEIKADPALAATGLVMMTSVGARGDAARMEKAGFAAYLVKPVRQSHFYDCLAAVVGPEGRGSDERGEAAVRHGRIITRHTLAERARRRSRILLAEDNLVNQKVALKALEKLGYHGRRGERRRPGSAGHQGEALRPHPHGRADAGHGRHGGHPADPGRPLGLAQPAVTIVALTAHAMAGDRERCLDMGMDDYLAKPIKAAELQEVIARWLAAGAGAWSRSPYPRSWRWPRRRRRRCSTRKCCSTCSKATESRPLRSPTSTWRTCAGQVASLREAIEPGDFDVDQGAGPPAQGRLGQRGSGGHAVLRRRSREAGRSAALSDREKSGVVAELDHQFNLLMALAEDKGGLM